MSFATKHALHFVLIKTLDEFVIMNYSCIALRIYLEVNDLRSVFIRSYILFYKLLNMILACVETAVVLNVVADFQYGTYS